MYQLKTWWNEKPLTVILFAGLLLRLLATIFSKGFGMLDDHFLIIEPAQAWVDHFNYNDWLPGNKGTTPSGHSFFYSGLHFIFFKALSYIGFNNPQGKMYVVRLIHALYSMITVYYGYKITEKLSTRAVANQVGLLLAMLWLWPFLSVRNLIEVVCIPPMILATWYAVKDDNYSFGRYLLVGVLLGFAFNMRFQTILFTGGFGLALLFNKRLIPAIATAIGFGICAFIVQGGVDILVWHHPFMEFTEYVKYNIANAHTYIEGPWYNYFLLLFGILIPPVSLFLLFGYFRSFRKHLLLFLPSFIFLLFHSYFPNKQERFILPIVPFIIILGCIGWADFLKSSTFWLKRPKLLHACWVFFWVINIPPLLVISVSYSKRNRVEAMSYLRSKGDVQALLIEDSNRDDYIISPMFYLGKWVTDYGVTQVSPIDSVYKHYTKLPANQRPNYMVLYQPENRDKRVANIERYHTLHYETTVEPSFVDWFVHWLNPVNDNQVTYIYKITGDVKHPTGNDTTQVK